MQRFLILTTLIMGLFSACNTISVDAVEKGKKLDKAETATVEGFFNDRMTNQARKAAVGTWDIMHKDEKYVYYGWPTFKGIFSNKRILKEFYKVDRKELEEKLSNYEIWEGYKHRIPVLNYFNEFYKAQSPENDFNSFECTLDYRLKNRGVEVDVYLINGKKPYAKMQLNPEDGSLIEISEY